MGLRLLAVGLVACLGVDPPPGDDVSTWTRWGQTWLCTTMDQWNAWTPLEEEMCLAGAEQAAAEPAAEAAPAAPAQVASAPAPAPACAPAAPAEAAETPGDRDFAFVVDEMVRGFAAGEPAPAQPAASPAPALTAATAATSVALDPIWAIEPEVQVTWSDTPAAAAPAEVASAEQPACCRETREATSACGQQRLAAVFTRNEPTAIVARETIPTMIAVVEDDRPSEAAPAAQALAFEPYEVPDDPFTGLAYELNRLSMEAGLEPAVAQVEPASQPAEAETASVSPASPPRADRLATAMRLTGEALQAWARVLQGPAVVSLRP